MAKFKVLECVEGSAAYGCEGLKVGKTIEVGDQFLAKIRANPGFEEVKKASKKTKKK